MPPAYGSLVAGHSVGPGWLEDHDNPVVWELLKKIPDAELWQTHYWLKIKLIDAIRERARLRWTEDDTSASRALTTAALLDPSVLTIGFARRFATYRRADLILHDSVRLRKLLNNPWRPIQFIYAGKAHPADDSGKRIIQELVDAARAPGFAGRIAFVEDYGEQLAQYMVHGVDVWLNNPLPPLEACGTSGMKAALNGVLHLSIQDGWWNEGFNSENGWSFEHQEAGGERDRADADSLYRILEDQVVPLYYDVSSDAVPHGWVSMMRESIRSSAAGFSASRMVKQYIDRFYAESPLTSGQAMSTEENQLLVGSDDHLHSSLRALALHAQRIGRVVAVASPSTCGRTMRPRPMRPSMVRLPHIYVSRSAGKGAVRSFLRRRSRGSCPAPPTSGTFTEVGARRRRGGSVRPSDTGPKTGRRRPDRRAERRALRAKLLP